MCSALKISVCIAAVLVIAVASDERRKRSDYDTSNPSPWQSPTRWGFRPSSNYNNIPSTKITRVNSYNPYLNERNIQRNQNRYSSQEQSSGWIPIIPNSNRQYNGGRYAQNGQQRPTEYSRINIRPNNPIHIEGILNGRTGQRQPSYSVHFTRANQLTRQELRGNNGKLSIQSNQIPAYRSTNQEYLNYPPLNNGPINPQFSTRYSLPSAIEGRFLGRNIHQDNRGYPVSNVNQAVRELNQQPLESLIRSNELPPVEGRILRVTSEQQIPVEEIQKTNDEQQLQNLGAINSGHLIRDNLFSTVQGQVLGANIQRPAQSGYAVQEISEPEEPINQQDSRVNNLVEANRQEKILAANLQRQSSQNLFQPDEELKQIIRVITPSNSIRSSEPQDARSQYLINNIAQHALNNGPGIDSSNSQRYSQYLAQPILRLNQAPALREPLIDYPSRQQFIQQSADSLTQPRIQVLKSDQLRGFNQLAAEELRQETLSAQLDALRSNGGTGDVSILSNDANQIQQEENSNANQQPDIYSYAELTAKIWKVIKANPAMMSNLDNLRQLLLDERNSRNEQIRELKGLLEEARRYNRNLRVYVRNQAGETEEQQERNKFVSDLIDTMNKNEESLNIPSRSLYGNNNIQRQGRYIVRPADVNPLIKNLLFSSGRNETQAQETTSVRPTPIIVRPNKNIPLPQLEVSEPFGLEQLEHHYDLTHWKQITESLKGNPFLQQYNILEHLL